MEGELDQDIDSAEEADAILTELADAIEREAGDLAVAIERLRDATEVDDEGNLELPDDVTLPFYEDQRELAFAIGLTVGAVLESKERAVKETPHRLENAEPAQQPDDAGDISQTVEQEQSVTVEA